MARQARILDFGEAKSASARRASGGRATSSRSQRSSDSERHSSRSSRRPDARDTKRGSRHSMPLDTKNDTRNSAPLNDKSRTRRTRNSAPLKDSRSSGSKRSSRNTRNSQPVKNTKRAHSSKASKSSRSKATKQNGRRSQRSNRQSRVKFQLPQLPQLLEISELPKLPPLPELPKLPIGFADKGIRIGSHVFGTKSSIAMIVCFCLVATCALLYTPSKNYYTAIRDKAKAEVAYEIVTTRNDALAKDVALLTSETGMEDRAREQYGWIKQGDNAITVTGLSEDKDLSAAEVLRTVTLNDVRAPETWYSPVLDPLFGYVNE